MKDKPFNLKVYQYVNGSWKLIFKPSLLKPILMLI